MAKVKSFDGIELFYEYNKGDDDKPVLVFLHGVGANLTLWRKELDYFKKKGFGCLALDLRGHGNSQVPKRKKDFLLPCFVDDVEFVLKHEKVNNFVFIGHSFGGSVVITYLVSGKKLMPSSVVLVESTYRYPFPEGKDLNMNPLVVYLMKFVVSKKLLRKNASKEIDLNNVSHIEMIFDELYYLPLQTIIYSLQGAKLGSEIYNNSIVNMFSSTDLPFLLVAGDIDETIGKEYSYEMHKMIKNSKLRVFKNTGHLLPLQKSKKLCLQMWKFLKN